MAEQAVAEDPAHRDASPPKYDEDGPPIKLGCSKCRYSVKGCKQCRRPEWRVRQQMVAKQRLQNELNPPPRKRYSGRNPRPYLPMDLTAAKESRPSKDPPWDQALVQHVVAPTEKALQELIIGAHVEIRSQEPGYRGAWFAGVVKEVSAATTLEGGFEYCVEYLDFVEPEGEAAGDGNVKAEASRDRVALVSRGHWQFVLDKPLLNIRPAYDTLVPAQPSSWKDFTVGQQVEGRLNSVWWDATVAEVLEAGGLKLEDAPEPWGEGYEYEVEDLADVRLRPPQADGHYGLLQASSPGNDIMLGALITEMAPSTTTMPAKGGSTGPGEGTVITAMTCREHLPQVEPALPEMEGSAGPSQRAAHQEEVEGGSVARDSMEDEVPEAGLDVAALSPRSAHGVVLLSDGADSLDDMADPGAERDESFSP